MPAGVPGPKVLAVWLQQGSVLSTQLFFTQRQDSSLTACVPQFCPPRLALLCTCSPPSCVHRSSCSSAPLRRRCLPFSGACFALPAQALVGQEYVPRWVSPRTRKFSELCGPTALAASPLSAACAATFHACTAWWVTLCFVCLFPLPLPVVGGRLPLLRNGRPEARLRWSELGSSPPLAALPCFGARFFSTQLNSTM